MSTPRRSTTSDDMTPRRSARIARIQQRTQVSLENGRGFSLVEQTVVEHGPYFKTYVYILESFIPLISWILSLVLTGFYFVRKYGKVLAIMGLLSASLLLCSKYLSLQKLDFEKSTDIGSIDTLSHDKVFDFSTDDAMSLTEDEKTLDSMEEVLIQDIKEKVLLQDIKEKVDVLEKVVKEMETKDFIKDIKEEVKREVNKVRIFERKQVKEIIQDVVKGDSKVDYALRSRGARVLEASRDYKSGFRSSWLKLLFPNFKKESRNKVQEVLEPTKRPGKCWAMDGTNGFVDIGLSQSIIPESVVIQYASLREINGFSSAPKRVQIFSRNTLIGNGTFDPRDENSNVFNLKKVSKPLDSLRVHVLSNWGHQDYTCIYQIQVFS